jgi:hypothetical protein
MSYKDEIYRLKLCLSYAEADAALASRRIDEASLKRREARDAIRSLTKRIAALEERQRLLDAKAAVAPSKPPVT